MALSTLDGSTTVNTLGFTETDAVVACTIATAMAQIGKCVVYVLISVYQLAPTSDSV